MGRHSRGSKQTCHNTTTAAQHKANTMLARREHTPLPRALALVVCVLILASLPGTCGGDDGSQHHGSGSIVRGGLPEAAAHGRLRSRHRLTAWQRARRLLETETATGYYPRNIVGGAAQSRGVGAPC